MNKDDSPSSEIQYKTATSQQILKAILDSTKSSIFLVAPDYRILFFNKFASDACKVLYGRSMFIGDNLLLYRQDGDEVTAKIFKEDFQHAILTKSPIAREREMRHPQLNYWVRMEYTPVFDDQKLIGVLLHVLNISERKKFQLQNEHQHKQLVDIAWSQSHETRQPVSTMLGLINILDKQSLTPDNQHIVNLMQETALKLDKVIQKTVILANKINDTNHTS
ncbi:MAG: PAS domain-containing protein [Chryseolinea sp.]